jgi:hypothetical protein
MNKEVPVKRVVLALIVGTILSLPLLYILELSSAGAITLLIFLCVGLVYILLLSFGALSKKRKEENQ